MVAVLAVKEKFANAHPEVSRADLQLGRVKYAAQRLGGLVLMGFVF
jgi:hypothetical protein